MNLPPLPSPMYGPDTSVDEDCRGTWSEEQMRDYARAALAAQTGAVGEDALIEVIRERDERDRVIDAILDLVLGNDRPEWSSAYGFHDAVNDVDEHMASLAAAPTEAKPAQDAVDAITDAEIDAACLNIALADFPRQVDYDRAIVRAAISAKKGG